MSETFVGTAATAARIAQLQARPGAAARSAKIRAEMKDNDHAELAATRKAVNLAHEEEEGVV